MKRSRFVVHVFALIALFAFFFLPSAVANCQAGGPGGQGSIPPAKGELGCPTDNWILHAKSEPGNVSGVANYRLTPDTFSTNIPSQVIFDASSTTFTDSKTSVILPRDIAEYTEGQLEAMIHPPGNSKGGVLSLTSGDTVVAIHDACYLYKADGHPIIDLKIDRSLAKFNAVVGGYNVWVRAQLINPSAAKARWVLVVRRKKFGVDEWKVVAGFREVEAGETHCDTQSANAFDGLPTGTDALGNYFEYKLFLFDDHWNGIRSIGGKAYVE